MYQPHAIPTDDLTLACFMLGEGAPVILINGGPGDDHRYLRPVAAAMADRLPVRCILYDQRGCGESRLERQDAETLHIQRFFADIDAIRRHFGYARISLFGHSWGAMLALAYAAEHPDAVDRQVLVGLGPLNPEMQAVARANNRHVLSEPERLALGDVKRARRAALEAGDVATFAALHQRQMREFSARSWFHNPDVAARFAEDFCDGYNFNPRITPLVWPSVMALDMLERARGLAVPSLIVYGYQDFEPITQAYVLAERMSRAEVCLLNECGHVPWLEQPEAFFAAVQALIGGE